MPLLFGKIKNLKTKVMKKYAEFITFIICTLLLIYMHYRSSKAEIHIKELQNKTLILNQRISSLEDLLYEEIEEKRTAWENLHQN